MKRAEACGPKPRRSPSVLGRGLIGGLLALGSAPVEGGQFDDGARVVVRAERLTADYQVDGHLNEEVYAAVPPVTGFVQQVPDEGAPASERTDVWVFYDDTNLYVAARCRDSAPRSEWVATELRRDSAQIGQGDTFGVLLDTFQDRRNGFLFVTNPLGALADQQITDERSADSDWNPIWDVKTQQDPEGWTVEMQIPFKSLRYGPSRAQEWGIQLRRVVRRLNEWSYITPVPIAAAGRDGALGIMRVSEAATLTGLDVPTESRNIEIKPYAIGGASASRGGGEPDRTEVTGDLGVDFKYGVTESLTADVTYNTDFAQVEVDEQQVNLTRFNLLLPEKREFFLEGRGIFAFGATAGQAGVPVVFFSRRIGLEAGEEVPILLGGRLSGKTGPYSIGALNIQTDDAAEVGAVATNFTVLRVKRDVLQRSAVGGLFTRRSHSTIAAGSNEAFGVDANFSFLDYANLTGYLARTVTPGLKGRDTSHQIRFDYSGDRYGATAEQVLVDRNFNPEVGFLRRENFRRNFAEVRFTPRPASMPAIRQFTFEGNIDYTVTADTGSLETRQRLFSFEIEFETSDRFEFDIVDNHERIDEPFDISGGLVPPGEYDFRYLEIVQTFGRQRAASGSVFLRRGPFYGGDVTVLEVNAARLAFARLPGLVIEPSVSLNWVDLPSGAVTTKLIRSRVSYSFSPRVFFSALLQRNLDADTFNASLRLRWEYRPGSELFVVFAGDQRTDATTQREQREGGWVVKVNRLFRL